MERPARGFARLSSAARRIGSWRPGFMGATVVVALLATPSFGFLARRLNDEHALAKERAEEADAALRADMLDQGWEPLSGGQALNERLGVELLVARRPFRLELMNGPLAGMTASERDVAAAVELLDRELGRYPPRFFEKSRLRRVLLCSDLRERAVPIPSLPNYHSTLLLDVAARADFLRRLVHHELFHFADYASDNCIDHDPAWEALNDHFFSYGSGGRFAREPGSARFDPALPGFLSRYSMSALEEDKAEVFAFSMVMPEAVAEVARRDRVVARKVDAIKGELARLSPGFEALLAGVR